MAKKHEGPRLRLKKAYHNMEFLNGPDARNIRVLCEFMEPSIRFRKQGIRSTVVFFGSTRILAPEVAQQRQAEVERLAVGAKGRRELAERLEAARRDSKMSHYYRDARELSRRLTLWSAAQADPRKRITICTGGGPGIMEAANRGASDAGGKSVGLNISLPMEQDPNPFQTPELALEFHYFFIRKFWFFYLARALAVFPGGFGTMDEMFELLTLVQTHKSRKYMPIILYDHEYWDKIVNFGELLRSGTISAEDLNLFRFFDDVDSAFDYLKKELSADIRPPDAVHPRTDNPQA
jgi:uncharacterized protein (TIGR00730 family)